LLGSSYVSKTVVGWFSYIYVSDVLCLPWSTPSVWKPVSLNC